MTFDVDFLWNLIQSVSFVITLSNRIDQAYQNLAELAKFVLQIGRGGVLVKVANKQRSRSPMMEFVDLFCRLVIVVGITVTAVVARSRVGNGWRSFR